MTYLFVSEDVKVIMSSVDIYLKCIGIFFIPLAVVNIYQEMGGAWAMDCFR